MKLNSKRKGFTLVELLIVIVVIGILSAMMMLSSTEAVSSARASNIISNLRNLKTAALAWYVDSMDVIDTTASFNVANNFDKVKHYLNNDTASDLTNYGIEAKDSKWYVYYESGKADTNVYTKLKSRAKSVGLLAGPDYTAAYNAENNKRIGMLVR